MKGKVLYAWFCMLLVKIVEVLFLKFLSVELKNFFHVTRFTQQ